MVTLTTIPIVLWFAVLLAKPRKPLPGNEVQELVYSRLLGGQRRVALLALVATMCMFVAGIAALSIRSQPSTELVSAADRVCTDLSAYPQTCYTQQSGGLWLVETLQSNDTWSKVATMSRPPTPTELVRGYHG